MYDDLTDVFGLEEAYEGITHVIHCGAGDEDGFIHGRKVMCDE